MLKSWQDNRHAMYYLHLKWKRKHGKMENSDVIP